MSIPQYPFGCTLTPFFQDYVTFYTRLDGLPSEKVLGIICEPSGDVWALTSDGAAHLTKGAHQWHATSKDALSTAIVRRFGNQAGERWLSIENGDNDLLFLEEEQKKGGASFSHFDFNTEQAERDVAEFSTSPVRNPTHFAMAPDGTHWLGSEQGVARLRKGVWHWFAGRRWLPSDRVLALEVDSEGSAWIGTDSGLVCLASLPMNWDEKAAHYEAITEARHCRDGYITDCRLTIPGDLKSFLPIASDNDGLWTALHVVAEAFRYAVTGDTEAANRARRGLNALLMLIDVTGIAGFPARAIVREGERVEISDPGPNWYSSPTRHSIRYKNDTSSDEVDGHFLAWYVYSKLVADESERARIAQSCRAVMRHILDHNYTLVGPTGKRTTWGVWTPEVLNQDPDWAAERGLNSLELLSHIRVALHLCPEPRFEEAYRDLIDTHGYAENTIRQKMLPPDADNNHSDDELAACAYYPLLCLEADQGLRRVYLESLERTHAILRPERSPFYNVLYGACTNRVCDAELSLQWLRETPLDLRGWTIMNSDRPDIVLASENGRFGERQAVSVLSPIESQIGKWNRNPYATDGGNGGATEEDGTFWLLPYWMGRYYGIFKC